jgi:SAM-dependent methyltransferase
MCSHNRQILLQEHLACPACHVAVISGAINFRCPNCHTVFDIEGNVPIMLMPERRRAAKGLERKKVDHQHASGFHKLKRLWTPPSPSLNLVGGAQRVVATMPKGAAILEVGSGVRRLREDVVNLEIDRFVNVDIIAVGDQIPFMENTFDLVISQAVLEHVQEPTQVVAEMIRVLKPGGKIYVEIPFLQGYHADPNDYQRYTPAGIDYLLRHVNKISSGIAVGPSSALVWLLREYIPLFAPRFMRQIVALAVAWLTTPVKYLDLFLARSPEARRIASGLYFLGTKPVPDAE